MQMGDYKVALTGLDGTGKSTQAGLLYDRERSRGRRAIIVHHASSKIPGLRALKRRNHQRLVDFLKRRGAHRDWTRDECDSTGGSRLSAVVAVGLVAGSFVKALWYCLRHRKSSLILDRCFLDDVVKVIWRLNWDSELLNYLIARVPRPDLLIVLEGDPGITFERTKKRNCSFEEYLGKEAVLAQVVDQAYSFGWEIVRVDAVAFDSEEVHERIVGFMEGCRRISVS